MRILTFLLCCGLAVLGQSIDLVRAAATTRPGGAAKTPQLRDFGNGVRCLECNGVFQSSAESNRASWDIPIRFDLSQSAGLMLTVKCSGIENVSQYSAYLHAGNSWYAANFELNGNGEWQDIFIPKSSFRREDKLESSWQNSNVLRISLWRGAVGRAGLAIAKAEFLRPNVSIALLRPTGNSAVEKQSLSMAGKLNNALAKYGILPAVIDDNDMVYGTLHLYKMLLVPLPDALSNNETEVLIACMRSGAKAGVFHALSSRLAAQMGTPMGKFAKLKPEQGSLNWILPEAQFLRGTKPVKNESSAYIAVDVLPKNCRTLAVWGNQEGKPLNKPAIIETASGFWMTHTYLNQSPLEGGALWYSVLSRIMPEIQLQGAQTVYASFIRWFAQQSADLRTQRQAQATLALEALQHGQYARCIELCHEIRMAGNGLAPTQQRRGEIRGLWCQNPAGLPGRNWAGSVAVLEQRSINTVFPQVAAPYYTAYQGRIVNNSIGNGLPECIEACHKRGIGVHAWMNCLDVEDASNVQIHQWTQEGRLQKDANGKLLRWLCPNNIQNRQMLARLAAEIVSKNAVDGIHFDRIRYPGSTSCYCANCRLAFERFAGTGPLAWPDAVHHGDLQGKWQSFRIASINSLLAEMINSVNTVRKGVMLSAAVYPDMILARQNVGQDWGYWLSKRWLSFACPMNYRGTTAQFSMDVQRQIRQLGNATRLVPGIGLGTHHLNASELQQQIDVTRRANTPGYVIFE